MALDPEFGTWSAWGNQYWPAEYFVDRQGHVRFAHFGEGDYEEKERGHPRAPRRARRFRRRSRARSRNGRRPLRRRRRRTSATPPRPLRRSPDPGRPRRPRTSFPTSCPRTPSRSAATLDDRARAGGRRRRDARSASHYRGERVFLVLGAPRRRAGAGRGDASTASRYGTVRVDGHRLYELAVSSPGGAAASRTSSTCASRPASRPTPSPSGSREGNPIAAPTEQTKRSGAAARTPRRSPRRSARLTGPRLPRHLSRAAPEGASTPSYARQNSASSRVVVVRGSSWNGWCPASGIDLEPCARGSGRRARARTAAGARGRARRPSPASGREIAPSRSAVSWSRSASAERQNASTDCGCALASAAASSHPSMIPSFQIRGAKHQRLTATRKSRIESAFVRGPHPAPDDLVEEAVAAAPGAVEDEAAHAARVRERELLRDRAAHRRADDVRRGRGSSASMSATVSAAKSAIRVRAVRRCRGATDAPVVERRDPIASRRPATWSTQHAPSSARPEMKRTSSPDALLLDPELDAACVDAAQGVLPDDEHVAVRRSATTFVETEPWTTRWAQSSPVSAHDDQSRRLILRRPGHDDVGRVACAPSTNVAPRVRRRAPPREPSRCPTCASSPHEGSTVSDAAGTGVSTAGGLPTLSFATDRTRSRGAHRLADLDERAAVARSAMLRSVVPDHDRVHCRQLLSVRTAEPRSAPSQRHPPVRRRIGEEQHQGFGNLLRRNAPTVKASGVRRRCRGCARRSPPSTRRRRALLPRRRSRAGRALRR